MRKPVFLAGFLLRFIPNCHFKSIIISHYCVLRDKRIAAIRYLYLTIGFIFVGLGFIGVWLPVMPTVPFLIVAAWCFSRSSPRFSRWLYRQPLFGPMLRNWDERGAINPKTKILAIISMAFGYGMFYFLLKPDLLWAIVVALIFIGSGVFVVSRPNN